jgi:hypothetical protein
MASGVFVLPDKRIPLVPNIGIIVGRDAVLVGARTAGARRWSGDPPRVSQTGCATLVACRSAWSGVRQSRAE